MDIRDLAERLRYLPGQLQGTRCREKNRNAGSGGRVPGWRSHASNIESNVTATAVASNKLFLKGHPPYHATSAAFPVAARAAMGGTPIVTYGLCLPCGWAPRSLNSWEIVLRSNVAIATERAADWRAKVELPCLLSFLYSVHHQSKDGLALAATELSGLTWFHASLPEATSGSSVPSQTP
jgi:hypothetical protein